MSFMIKKQCMLCNCKHGDAFPRRSWTRDLHVEFKILHLYDFMTILRRQQADVLHNHENEEIHGTG
jgi:hypothetical protein